MGIIKKLQAKPYEEKIRILKIATVLTAVLILVIWGLTLKFRATETGDASKFNQLFENIGELKSKFKDQNVK